MKRMIEDVFCRALSKRNLLDLNMTMQSAFMSTTFERTYLSNLSIPRETYICVLWLWIICCGRLEQQLRMEPHLCLMMSNRVHLASLDHSYSLSFAVTRSYSFRQIAGAQIWDFHCCSWDLLSNITCFLVSIIKDFASRVTTISEKVSSSAHWSCQGEHNDLDAEVDRLNALQLTWSMPYMSCVETVHMLTCIKLYLVYDRKLY